MSAIQGYLLGLVTIPAIVLAWAVVLTIERLLTTSSDKEGV